MMHMRFLIESFDCRSMCVHFRAMIAEKSASREQDRERTNNKVIYRMYIYTFLRGLALRASEIMRARYCILAHA